MALKQHKLLVDAETEKEKCSLHGDAAENGVIVVEGGPPHK